MCRPEDIQRLAEVLSLNCEMEGMKAINLERTSNDMAAAWDERDFSAMADRIMQAGVYV